VSQVEASTAVDAADDTASDRDDFAPTAWLRNRHLQSVWPSLPLRRPAVARRARSLLAASTPVILDCGDGVRLSALHAAHAVAAREAPPLVVLLHGWEGSASSLYLISLGQRLFDRGFDVLRLNLRDHGDSHHLNEGIFHSCRIDEVVGAVRRVQQLHPGRPLALAGFSLGGNFCLRVAARAALAGLDLRQVVAICPVLDPEHTLTRLETGWVVYRRYFVWKWQRSLAKKQAAWQSSYDLGEVLRMSSLTSMTDYLARHFGGFPSLQAYLRGYSVVDGALGTLAAPTRIIAAADDPIIPVEDLARIAPQALLTVQRTRFGGHCGYYDGAGNGNWIERQVCSLLDAAV
jgi:predicted alpha/beta-fold hydrolase